MLEHADRGDLVEGLGLRQLAVVAQLDRDAAAQAAFVDQPADMRVLVFAQRDAVRLHAVVFGGPQQQRAPAGTDVEETFARAQHQLAADVVELGFLRLHERHAGVAKVGT